MDASNYASEALEALRLIEKSILQKVPLSDLSATIWHPVQKQARTNFKRIYTEPDHGVPFVGSRTMFELPMRLQRHLSRLIPKLGDLMVPLGWILVSRSGTVGNALLVSGRLEGFAITEHAIRIEPRKGWGGYLYAYLASRFGQALISRGVFGATVDELEPKHLAEIPVPIVDPSTHEAVEEAVCRAYDQRDTAQRLFDEADELLHRAMMISPFTDRDVDYLPSKRDLKAFAISSSELNGRFDVSQHVPITRSAINKLRRSPLPLRKLGDLTDSVSIPGRFKREYVREGGIYFLLPSQLLTQRPYGLKRLSSRQVAQLPDLVLSADQVLLTTDGTVGRVHLVTHRMAGWAGSNNMARIRPGELDAGYLYAFLATPFGQHQVAKEIYGGVIDHITEGHIESVLCPVTDAGTQRRIGDLVRSGFAAKDAANQAEDEAISALESAIAESVSAAA